MFDAKTMNNVPYFNIIRFVMYLMVITRPDIDYSISYLSRYMSTSGMPRRETLKWLLRFLKYYAHI